MVRSNNSSTEQHKGFNISHSKFQTQNEFRRERCEIQTLVEEIIEKEAISLPGVSGGEENENLTILDLFAVPLEKISIDLIQKYLDVDGNPENSLRKFSEYFCKAKKYFNDYLHINLPSEIENIKEFKSKETVLNFLHQTRAFNTGKGGKAFSPFYCAIAKQMLVEYTYETKEFEGLAGESRYLFKKLFEPAKDKTYPFLKKAVERGDGWQDVFTNFSDEKNISFLITSRGKNPIRTKTKMAKKSTFDISEAINDGLGLKMEVSNEEDAQELFEFLGHYFIENYRGKKMVARDNNFLTDQNRAQFQSNFQNVGIKFEAQKNQQSHKNYRALDLKGVIEVRKNGERNGVKIERNIEVQIVLVGNSNEAEMSRHEVYEAKQKLSVVTRYFGAFPEDYLDLICLEAAQKSDLPLEKIKQHILKSNLVKLKCSDRRPKYATKDHFNRLKDLGFLNGNIHEDNTEKKKK